MNLCKGKPTYLSLAGLGLTLFAFSHAASATSTYFGQLDSQCAALNGAGSTRNPSVGCTTCHSSSFVLNTTGSAYVQAGHKPTSAISSILCALPTATNTAPTANAGPDQSVKGKLPLTVTLNGTGTDKEGDPLTFAWMLKKKPAGSRAALSDKTAAAPTFSADKAGQYQAQLVVNDGKLNSTPDSVTVTVGAAANTPPVANAGLDQHVLPNTNVKLNGGGTDADGDPLTYRWTLKAPAGSTAALSDAKAMMPTFTADLAGGYTATLVVNDGKVDSAPDTVVVTAGTSNTQPVANAGKDVNAAVNTEVALNGSGFDADGDALTYKWSFTKKPKGSIAAFSNASIAQPTFTPDKTGEYIAQLIVNDGITNSKPDSALVKVSSPVVDTVNVNLEVNVDPSTLVLSQFGKSAAIKIHLQAQNTTDNAAEVPLLVNVGVTKPDGSKLALGQKHVQVKEGVEFSLQYTPKQEGQHVVNVTVTDQTGNTLVQQSKTLTVTLTATGGNDDDGGDDDGDENEGNDD